MPQSAVARVSPVFLGLIAATAVGGGIVAYGDGSSSNVKLIQIGSLLLLLGAWGVSLCLHEFGHAVTAFRGGDLSVRDKGYLTLDPRHYMDPVLSLVLPMVFLLLGGIPLPGGAVWINHHALRTKGIRSLVSLAGPLMNLLIGVALSLLVRFGFPAYDMYGPGSQYAISNSLGNVLSFIAMLQIMAFFLNILPIPGLDGFGAIEPYLSPATLQSTAKAKQFAPFILFAVLWLVPPVRTVFFDFTDWLYSAVGGYYNAAVSGQQTAMFWRS
jgi:Zn-dependent protease